VDFRLPIFPLIALAFCTNAAAAPAEPPPRIEKPANSSPAQPEKPPLNFYVAKGPDDACGAGCNEWIAAEGRFDFESYQRLRAFLNRLSGRKLPIYFACSSAATLAVAYIRGLAGDEIGHVTAIKLTASGRDLVFPRIGKVSKIDALDNGATFDSRAVRAPLDFFDKAAAAESIDIVVTDLADPALAPRVRRLSTSGLGSAVEVLRRRCAAAP
jgi:hypothetical protein